MSRVIEKGLLGRAVLQYDALAKKPTESETPMAICMYNRNQKIPCRKCFLKSKLPWVKSKDQRCTMGTDDYPSVLYTPISCRAAKVGFTKDRLMSDALKMREVLISIYKEHYNVDMG